MADPTDGAPAPTPASTPEHESGAMPAPLTPEDSTIITPDDPDAARRRAISDLLFFCKSNDLDAVKEIVLAQNFDLADTCNVVDYDQRTPLCAKHVYRAQMMVCAFRSRAQALGSYRGCMARDRLAASPQRGRQRAGWVWSHPVGRRTQGWARCATVVYLSWGVIKTHTCYISFFSSILASAFAWQ